MASSPIIILTGEAGIGKTTIIERVLEKGNFDAGGFITGEIREQGRRVGFEIASLSGETGKLAHVAHSSRYKVGKYYVNIEDLERVGVDAIRRATEEKNLIVIDEIGKMELFSRSFRAAVRVALDSRKSVLASIMYQKNSFADGIKQLPHVQVFEVNKQNRNWLVDEVIRRLSLPP